MSDRLLGLPVHSRRATAASVLGLFAYYAATMCRSLSMYDSPELAMVAEQLGLGHPLGQPLHTLVGGILATVPGIDPLIALNGLSAFVGALTVVPATSLADAWFQPDPDRSQDPLPHLIAPTIALVGAHPALWEPSTRVEVYPLATFFALWAAARFAHAFLGRDPTRRTYVAIGLALGLSASANVVCAAGTAFAIAPVFLVATLRDEIPFRSIGFATFGGLLGLLTYGYVFVVAGRQDVFVWGAPTHGAAIHHYFTATDFSFKAVASASLWWTHVGELVVAAGLDGTLALWLAGLAGYVLFARGQWFGAFFFAAILSLFIAFIARNGVFAIGVLDYAGYMAIPTWVAAAGTALFLVYLGSRNAWAATAAIAALLVLLMVAPPALHARTRHRDSFTEDIAREALVAAPPDAIVIVEHDHWIAPMLYLQEQRGVRPDVVLVAHGLASSEWYWTFLYRRHPGLALIELRAAGGRDGRIRRFLRANSTRPVQVERVALAAKLGLRTCPSDWLLDVRARCRPLVGEPALAHVARAALAELGRGSPDTDGLIALATLHRGHDLYSHGRPRAAVATLLAGVPDTEGLRDLDLGEVPVRIAPDARPTPAYDPHVPLGHPAQNLHYAALIAMSTGATRVGRPLAALAEAVGPVEPKFAPLPASPDSL